MEITTFSDLQAFMQENYYLHDACVRRIVALHSGEIDLDLLFQVSGGYEGGAEITNREMNLRFQCLRGESGVVPLSDPENCCEEPDFYEMGGHMGMTFYLPETFAIEFERLTVWWQDIRTRQLPLVSSSEARFDLLGREPPHPEDWISVLQRAHRDSMVWRYYSGPAMPIEAVPWPEYSGWFLQRQARLSENPYGILLGVFFRPPHPVGLSIEVKDETLLHCLPILVSFMLERYARKVRTGNVELDRKQWRLLQSGQEIAYCGLTMKWPNVV